MHPDVRSILLTQKAFAEGGRALVYYASAQGDILTRSQDPEARRNANEVLRLLTPIIKAFLTETGFESANLGMQCLGGHGYIMFSGYLLLGVAWAASARSVQATGTGNEGRGVLSVEDTDSRVLLCQDPASNDFVAANDARRSRAANEARRGTLHVLTPRLLMRGRANSRRCVRLGRKLVYPYDVRNDSQVFSQRRAVEFVDRTGFDSRRNCGVSTSTDKWPSCQLERRRSRWP